MIKCTFDVLLLIIIACFFLASCRDNSTCAEREFCQIKKDELEGSCMNGKRRNDM